MAFPGKVHGRGEVFKIDTLGAALADISAFLDTFKLTPKMDRPQTATFGDAGERTGQVLGLRAFDISAQGYIELTAAQKAHGRGAKVLLSGYSLGSAFNKGKFTRKLKFDDTTTFGSAWRTFDVPGLQSGDVSLNGFYAGVAADTEQLLISAGLQADPALAQAIPIGTFGMFGYAIGNMVELFSMAVDNYGIDGGENKNLDLSLSGKSDGVLDLGYSLHDLVQESGAAPLSFTAAPTGGEPVSTALGGVAVLQATQFTGTTATVIVQTSPDNATWTTLATFAAVTSATPQAQLVSIPVGTTIDKYCRAQISAATYTSMTFQVSVARRGFTAAMVTPGTHKHLAALFSNQTWIANQAPWLFEYDPQGTAVGNPKKTGSLRLEQYGLTFDENQSLKFDLALKGSGTLTDGFN